MLKSTVLFQGTLVQVEQFCEFLTICVYGFKKLAFLHISPVNSR